ncbi:MAG: class I SAM-dependent methyltransferase, partial [Candidatus Omnitrophota bacterium]
MNIEKSTVWAYQQMFDNIDLGEKDLLDVGGGKAIAGFLYGKSLRHYVCIDTYQGRGNPSENFQITQNKIKSENIRNMEITRMDLEGFYKHNSGRTFEIVLASNVLHHIFS